MPAEGKTIGVQKHGYGKQNTYFFPITRRSVAPDAGVSFREGIAAAALPP